MDEEILHEGPMPGAVIYISEFQNQLDWKFGIETTSLGLCGQIYPSRTSEHGGKKDCVIEGGGEEGQCVKS